MKFACFAASLLAIAMEKQGVLALQLHQNHASEPLSKPHHHAQTIADAYGEGYAAAELDIANLMTMATTDPALKSVHGKQVE